MGYSRWREAVGEELASVFQILDCGKEKWSDLRKNFRGDLCEQMRVGFNEEKRVEW